MTDMMDSSRPTLEWSPAAMFRLVTPLRPVTVWFCFTVLAGFAPSQATAQQKAEPAPGQFFQIVEPITHDTFARVRAATRQLVDRQAATEMAVRPILVFQFLPGDTAPASSEFGACYDVASLISRDLAGAKLTVAYVPQPLKGYAVLPAVACTEIIMGSSASLGPITPESRIYDPALRDPVKFLAIRKTREPDLLLGMLDRDADLRMVRTADRAVHYVLAENMTEFLKNHHISDSQPAWEAGARGVLTAKRAREEGFCKRTAESPAELASMYQLGGRSAVDDPTLGQSVRPDWIKLEGVLDNVSVSFLSRKIEDARQHKKNLFILEIDSPGGTEAAGDRIADILSEIKDMKTIAYINERALGIAALIPLACRDIVLKKGSRIGDVRETASGRNSAMHKLSDMAKAGLAKKAATWAKAKGHPEAVAVAMIDPEAEIVEAADSQTGASRLILRSEAEAERDRYRIVQTRKSAGSVLTMNADDAASFGLGHVVADGNELKDLYALSRTMRVEGPGWVDWLVTVLTNPYVSWMLLFIGAVMLVVELKLPGIGLPAIISAVAFLLFFGSHYLSGTADQLEIILFLIGLICIALEIFVFPGFGVFGMSGILLMLCSVVLASQTFIWPTQDYEYRELGHTLLQLTGVLLAAGACTVVLARYFPSLPLFNRLILKPEPWTAVLYDDAIGKGTSDGYESLAFLIGETGRTTTPLRPTGKARFGSLLLDVTAGDRFVDPDSLIEVVDVQGPRVIVKKIGS
jgi:membrane-bound serine protease (ClpP class)